ncbi:MAG: GFA family protein [Legionella sp.]
MNQYKGKCLCGACFYVVKAEKPQAMYLCHCSRCRKETGSIHGANVFFNEAQLVWEEGQKSISLFKLEGTRKKRAFCTNCGCPLPRQEGESHVIIPAGTLDDDVFLEPTAHIYYASRSSWEDKIRDAPRFDELPTIKTSDDL